MIIIRLIAFAAAVLAQNPPQVNFMLSCGLYPQVCNNKCYAVFRGGAPRTVTWSGLSQAQTAGRRRIAGTEPNPCCNGRITAPPVCSNTDGTETTCTSPDEYPYASTDEFGNGPAPNGPTFIRCTGIDENVYEGMQDYNNGILRARVADGGCGQIRGCRITIGFQFVGIYSDACINGANAVNDGHYWQYNGAYSLVPRDGEEFRLPLYQRADPPLELAIAPERRRELVLDNGDHVIVAPEADGDPERAWIGEVWMMGANGTSTVVRELFGDEKSKPFRPGNVTL
ncbi:hypothetical protein CBER1_05264 [Cercospora berteroae]|uniref:Deoxyribonuclease NucA/NucB domain-containing protein n=1 Tax=Cercospora berteroae TaxID=357750 RepID=A0A2S6BT52_9PEZI|nr:hypothetical protein CBER1_05264 [Cercospora berteroae]